MEALLAALQAWDDSRVAYAKVMYQQLHTQPNFINHLIQIAENYPKLHHNVTWLLKHHADQKGQFTSKQSQAITRLLVSFENWAEKLHILQTMPSLQLSKGDLEVWEVFIGEHLDDPQNFVRTSAYHGLYVLSQYQPKIKSDVLTIFKAALESDHGASVKARLRKLIKLLEKELK